MLKLYENIRNRRLELTLTQDELARRLGYSGKSMIAKIEKGLVDLPQSKIEAFADALHTTPCVLMGWDTEDSDPVTLRPDESSLLSDYNRLNPLGRDEASKRVKELTQIESYIKDTGSQSA